MSVMSMVGKLVLPLLLLCLDGQPSPSMVDAFAPRHRETITRPLPIRHLSNLPSSNSSPQPPQNLAQLLADLDRGQVRYTPMMTRGDLERLWLDQFSGAQPPSSTSKANAEDRVSSPAQLMVILQRLPLSALLEELRQADIRFTPTASRAELEKLLLEHRLGLQQQPMTAASTVEIVDNDTGQTEAGASADFSEENTSTAVGTTEESESEQDSETIEPEIVAAEIVDMKRHRPGRPAMEEEDDDAFSRAAQRRRRRRPPPPSMGYDEEEGRSLMTRAAARRRRRRYLEQDRKRLTVEGAGDVVQRAGDATYRIARQSLRKARDWWAVDEDGVRTVHPTVVKSTRRRQRDNSEDEERTYRVRPIIVPPSESPSESEPKPFKSESEPQATTAHRASGGENAQAPEPIISPPNRDGGAPYNAQFGEDETLRPRRRRRPRSRPDPSSPTSHKRIYSPYAASSAGDRPNEEEYDLEELQEMFTSAADYLMFGGWEQQQQQEQYESSNTNRRPSRQELRDDDPAGGRGRRPPPQHQQRDSPRAHWKDRIEERLDSVLGIHEKGEFYNSWMNREEEEQTRYNKYDRSPYDAFAVAQGRPRPSSRKRRIGSSRDFPQQPLWHDLNRSVNGGARFLSSLLFGSGAGRPPPRAVETAGRAPRGGPPLQQEYNSSPLFAVGQGGGGGTLLTAFGVLRRAGNVLCHWASVRGSIPQPVVVLGVATAGLCAQQRLRAMILTLLAMRTVGELMVSSFGANWGSNDYGYQHYDEEEDFQESDETSSRRRVN